MHPKDDILKSRKKIKMRERWIHDGSHFNETNEPLIKEPHHYEC